MEDRNQTQEEMVDNVKQIICSDIEELVKIYSREKDERKSSTRAIHTNMAEFSSMLICAGKLGLLDIEVFNEIMSIYIPFEGEFYHGLDLNTLESWNNPRDILPEAEGEEIVSKIKKLIDDPRNKMNHKYEIVIKD